MKFSKKHINMLNILIEMGIDRASRLLSKTLRTPAIIKIVNTSVLDVCKITERLNEDEREMVASLMIIHEGGDGKILFMVTKKDALILKDLYLEDPVGSSKNYDIYVESTIQEIGNVLSGAICNSLSTDFGISILPTPPLVTCDYAGTIFATMIIDEALEDDELLLIDTRFAVLHYNFDCYFYMLPGTKILKYLDERPLAR